MAAKAKNEASPAQKAVVLKVKTGQKYRGARQAWYDALVAHDGKSQDEFIEATTKKPPAMTKAGTAENPKGWLRFFVRTGVASLS